jgi:hypothetical protein
MDPINTKRLKYLAIMTIPILIIFPCGFPSIRSTPTPFVISVVVTATPEIKPIQQDDSPPEVIPTEVIPTNTPVVVHAVSPTGPSKLGALIYDVDSSGTGPEGRAPYGDSYDINRLERPFQEDMTYIPDMDIATYNLNQDETWIYVSIELIGTNPNNELGIHFGVEIDNDADGFGDTIIWAHPTYTSEWSATNVQVYNDENHDTGGLSAEKSDAPLEGDGYETLIYDGGVGEDPDLAWVRINAGVQATVQFAFKRTLTDGAYMLGVLADAGLKDVGMLDYVDRFTEEEAGSPERSEEEYPLKALYSVDNVCREAFGFKPTGYEPQLCPRPDPTAEPSCKRPSQYTDQASCEAGLCAWVQDPVTLAYQCEKP